MTAAAQRIVDQWRAEQFGAQLLAARIAAQLTPRKLSVRAGLHADAVDAIEDGARLATPAEMAALEGALGMGPGELGRVAA